MVKETERTGNIVVIDDEESIREGCRQSLEAEGYRIRPAGDGTEGLRLIEQFRPEVVLVDLRMPGLSGMDVIARLREMDPSIVPIVITGYGSIDNAVEAMKRGACDFVTKPFDPEGLLKVVERGMARHAQRKDCAKLESEKKRALNNCAAIVGHQLKSPIAAASQCLESVIEGYAGSLNDEQKRIIGRACHRINELSASIEGWTKLSQAEAGALELHRERIDLGELIRSAWETLPEDGDRAGITFKMVMGEDVKPFEADRRLLREVFVNLFQNAVTFTPRGGSVRVEGRADRGRTVITVTDTGTGIREEEIPYIFEPYFRGRREGQRKQLGAGLGMAIAKKIVEAHGGTIRAGNDPEAGAVFTIAFRTTELPPAVPMIEEERRLPPTRALEPPKPALGPVAVTDVLAPRAIAEATVELAKKKSSLPLLPMILLGALAGIYIGFGAELCTMVTHDLSQYVGIGMAKLVGGAVFSVGLMLVVIAGAELFTGNCLMLAGVLSGKCTTRAVLRNWSVVFLANFAGSIFLAVLMYYSGLWKTGNLGVGASAVKTAYGKVNLGFAEAFFRGVGCNWLVCLAVWIAIAARGGAGKILGIFFPIMAFVASGFEHCVANMYFVSAGLFLKGNPAVVKAAGLTGKIDSLTWSSFLTRNLLPVTLGNLVGGALFVGGLYYWIYLRRTISASPRLEMR